MIDRTYHLNRLTRLLSQFPIVAILGPRQVGKTTLARQHAAESKRDVSFFDLEDEADLALFADPMITLRPLKGLIVVDEVQRRPELFPSLRVLADQPKPARRFLLLGSASPQMLSQTSESLAGRIAYHELGGFSLDEVGSDKWEKLWHRGGFPRSFLARSEGEGFLWRTELIRTYLEREIPSLGLRLPAATMRRFWMMLAHYHGQVWNASEFGRAFGVAHTTVQRYLDTLSATFMVRQLSAWYENIGKRQVKAPKVYVRDSGLLHALLGLQHRRAIESHPKVGASWEGFALETTIKLLDARAEECFFWATHTGVELDLLIVRGEQRFGFEFKRNSSPTLTKSMSVALEVLGLRKLIVIHAGSRSFPLGDAIHAVALADIQEHVKPLRGR